MGGFSPMHWMIMAMVVVLLFGGGRVSGLMGDLARGIKTFRKTMAEDTAEAPKRIGPGALAADEMMTHEPTTV
jgi:sec-independent protein translocase protein TatA